MAGRRTTAYLDIETSWSGNVTVVGIYRPGRGTEQLVRPDVSAASLRAALKGVRRIVTYNGSRFDLPVLSKRLGVELPGPFRHHDLMYRCWKNGLKGGLKKVEMLLGIHRDTEGVDGYEALKLWEAYKSGSADALELLLRYNREDVENLEILEDKLDRFDGREKTSRASSGGHRKRILGSP